MLSFIKARVVDWLFMALAITLGVVVTPAIFSDAEAEELRATFFPLAPLFMGIYIIMDLTYHTAKFIVSSIAMKYFGETIRKHLRNYGIGIERPESGT